MSIPLRKNRLHAAVAALGLVLMAAHAPAFATPDLPIAVKSCLKEGRDPVHADAKYTRTCGVSPPGDPSNLTTWRRLELMATDSARLGGNVVASLNCISRKTGDISRVATVSSVYATSPKTLSTLLPGPLNFAACAYYIHIDVDSVIATATVQMVVLRD